MAYAEKLTQQWLVLLKSERGTSKIYMYMHISAAEGYIAFVEPTPIVKLFAPKVFPAIQALFWRMAKSREGLDDNGMSALIFSTS